MADEIFNESHYFMCSGGLKPARFKAGQEVMQKEDGNYYLTEYSLTCKGIDFSCKWVALLCAIIAAALALLASNPAGWVLLAAIGGAIGGAIIGGAICGSQAAILRTWIVIKEDAQIGEYNMVSNHKPVHLTCDLFSNTITFKPNIKNEFEALCIFATNTVMTGLEGFMYVYAFRGGSLLATGKGAAFLSNLGVNYVASLGVKGVLLRGLFAGYNATNAYYMSNTEGGSKEETINAALDGGLFIERALYRIGTMDYNQQVYNTDTDEYENKFNYSGLASDIAMPLSLGGLSARPGTNNDARPIDVKNKFNQTVSEWKNPVETIKTDITALKNKAIEFRDKLKSQLKGDGAHQKVSLKQLALEERARLDMSNKGEQAGNVAVYEYIDPLTGELVQEVYTTQPNTSKHAERIGWETLEQKGIPQENVTRIYSELAPCELPSGGAHGEGCKHAISERFPNAEVTYSHQYPGSTGKTRAAREAGMSERNTDFSRESGKQTYPTNKDEIDE